MSVVLILAPQIVHICAKTARRLLNEASRTLLPVIIDMHFPKIIKESLKNQVILSENDVLVQARSQFNQRLLSIRLAN